MEAKEETPIEPNEVSEVDLQENIVWDTPESAKLDEMIQLATETGVPRQVLDCLLECGFDSVARVAILRDVGEIERFFRDNSFLYEADVEKRRRLYGLYERNPERFMFLPGHRNSLQHLVRVAHNLLPENRDNQLSISPATVTQPVEPVSNAAAIARQIELARRANRDKNGRRLSKNRTSGSASVTEPIASSADDFDDEDADREDSCSTATQTVTAEEIMQSMKVKFHKWCSTHSYAAVKRLQLGRDFRINILCSRDVDDIDVRTHPLPISSFGVEIACLMCSGKVRLLPRHNSFVSSNATRHLYRCARGMLPKRGRRGRGGNTAGNTRRRQPVQPEEDGEVVDQEQQPEVEEQTTQDSAAEVAAAAPAALDQELEQQQQQHYQSGEMIGMEAVVNDEVAVVEDSDQTGVDMSEEVMVDNDGGGQEFAEYAAETMTTTIQMEGISDGRRFELAVLDASGNHLTYGDGSTLEAVYTVTDDHELVDGEIYYIDESNQLCKLQQE